MNKMKRWISAFLAVVMLTGTMSPMYVGAAELEDPSALVEETFPVETTEAETEASEPVVTEPQETEAEVTEPEETEPQETEAEVTEPEETEPQETEAEVTEPEETEPQETEAEVTEPEETEPQETEAEATEPQETEAEMTEAEETQETAAETEATEEFLVEEQEASEDAMMAEVYSFEELRETLKKATKGTVVCYANIDVPECETLTIPKNVTLLVNGEMNVGWSANVYVKGTLKMLGQLCIDGMMKVSGKLDMQRNQLSISGYLFNDGEVSYDKNKVEIWYDSYTIEFESPREGGAEGSYLYDDYIIMLPGETLTGRLRKRVELDKVPLRADASVWIGDELSDSLVLTYKNGAVTLTAQNVEKTVGGCIECNGGGDDGYRTSMWIDVRPIAKKLELTDCNRNNVSGKRIYATTDDGLWLLDCTVFPEDAYVDLKWSNSNPNLLSYCNDEYSEWWERKEGAVGTDKVSVKDAVSGLSASVEVDIEESYNLVFAHSLDSYYEAYYKPGDWYVPGGTSKTLQVLRYNSNDGSLTPVKSSELEWSVGSRWGDNGLEPTPWASIDSKGKLTANTVKAETEIIVTARYKGDSRSGCYVESYMRISPSLSNFGFNMGGETWGGNTVQLDYEGASEYGSFSAFFTSGDRNYELGDFADNKESEFYWFFTKYSWNSSNPDVAMMANDVLHIISKGKTTLTLTAVTKDGKKLTSSANLIVGTPVNEINLLSTNESDITLYHNELRSTSMRKGDSIFLNGAKASLVKSSDKDYVTIKNGVIKAKSVDKARSVLVNVTSKNGAVKATLEVWVHPAQNTLLVDCNGYIGKTGAMTMSPEEESSLYAVYVDYWDYIDVESQNVKWKSSKTSVAKVNSDGVVTAVKSGTAKITGTYNKQTVTVTVKVTKGIEEIWVETKSGGYRDLALASGKSAELVLKARYSDESVATLPAIWEISAYDSRYATINSSGKLTAAKGLRERVIITVNAYWKSNPSYKTSMSYMEICPAATAVNLYKGGDSDRYLSGTINASRYEELQLGARVYPENAYGDVTWKSSDTKIAIVDKYSGVVMPKKTGKVTITATARDGSGKKASITVNFMKPVDYVDLDNVLQVGEEDWKLASVVGGKTMKLKPVLYDAYGNKATNQKVTYSLERSYDGYAYATVNKKGELKTSKVLTKKTVGVIVASVENPEIKNTFEIDIYPKAVSKVSIYLEGEKLGSKATVENGTYKTLEALVSPGNGMCLENVIWKSSDKKVVSINPYTGEFECLKPGKATITVTARDGSGKKATVKITVKKNWWE